MAPSVGIVGDAARQYGRLGGLVYCGCRATSVISFNSVDSIVYRHSSPRPGRRPLIRTNLDSEGDSCPSTSISNSPASNFSRLRDATAFALNACVTLSFVFTCHLVKTGCMRVVPAEKRDGHISARAALPLSTAAT